MSDLTCFYGESGYTYGTGTYGLCGRTQQRACSTGHDDPLTVGTAFVPDTDEETC